MGGGGNGVHTRLHQVLPGQNRLLGAATVRGKLRDVVCPYACPYDCLYDCDSWEQQLREVRERGQGRDIVGYIIQKLVRRTIHAQRCLWV
jgi:pyruvate-formate lyase-activating enzyme